MNIKTRLCGEADLDQILSIINDGAEAYRGIIPDDRWHEPYMTREELKHEIAKNVIFWGCERDGVLVAVMGMQHVRDVTLIRHAYVRTAARGQGLGSELLKHFMGRTEGPMLIGTWAAATWAISFYEKHGFQVVGSEMKDMLLQAFWDVPERQVQKSVVLTNQYGS